MNEPARRIERVVWVGLALVTASILLVVLVAALKLRTALGKPLPIDGMVADFTLTNEAGKAVSLSDLRGHIWVADIIFTRCPGQCLRMTSQMKELQNALPSGGRAKLVSLTTDPDYDTPPVLAKYAERFGADTDRWTFLTGSKRQLADLAINSLKLTVIEKPQAERDSPNDLFVHSTYFVLVDRQAQVRGVYQTVGDDVDFEKVKPEIVTAIRRLERER